MRSRKAPICTEHRPNAIAFGNHVVPGCGEYGCRSPACLASLLFRTMGLGCVADLSTSVSAPNGAQSWTAGRSCAAGAVPSAGAVPRRSRPDQVHARSPARAPGAPHRIQVTWSMRIAYLVNRYPTVSHSFIRREILALERQRGRGHAHCATRVGTRAVGRGKPARARTHALCPSRRRTSARDCLGADAADPAGATAAGTGAGVAHGSPRGPSAARAPHLSGRGLLASSPGCARQASSICMRTSAPIRPRSRCSCMPWAGHMELHRPRARRNTTMCSSLAWQRRSGAAPLSWRSAPMAGANFIAWSSTSIGRK